MDMNYLTKPRSLGVSCLALALLASLGCSDGVVPFEATVLLDGQPLTNATVSFIRSSGETGRAAFGMTDSEGRTRLTTYEKHDGALPGAYAVVVIKAEGAADAGPTPEDAPPTPEQLLMSSAPQVQSMRRARKPAASAISKVYSSPRTTPLSCQVEPGMDDPVFEITTP